MINELQLQLFVYSHHSDRLLRASSPVGSPAAAPRRANTTTSSSWQAHAAGDHEAPLLPQAVHLASRRRRGAAEDRVRPGQKAGTAASKREWVEPTWRSKSRRSHDKMNVASSALKLMRTQEENAPGGEDLATRACILFDFKEED